MKTWAFLYRADGCDPAVHRADLVSDTRRSIICGVNSIDEGCKLARDLMEQENCLLIELCGGFGAQGARRVIAAVDGRIPVGYIDYFPEELEKLAIMKA